MFEETRALLDRYENLFGNRISEEEFEWLKTSNFDFAKAMYKEIPCIETVAKIILAQAGVDNIKIKVE